MCRSSSHCSGGRRCPERGGSRTLRHRNATQLRRVENSVTPMSSTGGVPVPQALTSCLDETVGIEEDVQVAMDSDNLSYLAKKYNPDGKSVEDVLEDIEDENTEGKLVILYKCLESEELRGIENREMLSVTKSSSDSPGDNELVSKKRRLKICLIRARLEEYRNLSMPTVKDAEKFLPLVRESGALISAEGAYRSGLYPNEMRNDFENEIKTYKDNVAQIASLSREINDEILGNKLPLAVKDGEIDYNVISEAVESQNAEDILSALVSNYPDHDVTKSFSRNALMKELLVAKNAEIVKTGEYMSTRLNTACLDVIRESRSFGLGESGFKYHPMSDSKIAAKVSEISDRFPTDWWESSDGSDLLLVNEDSRAHFQPKKNMVITKGKVQQIDKGHLKESAKRGFDLTSKPLAEKLVDVEKGEVFVCLSPGSTGHAMALDTLRAYKGSEYVSAYREKGVWVKVKAEIKEVTLDEVKDESSVSKKGWSVTPSVSAGGKRKVYLYRPVEKVQEYTSGVSKISLSTDKHDGAFSRDAVHELTHFFEYTKRSIGKMEGAFYQDRTKGCEVREYNASKKPSGTKPEFLRADGFVDAYMGKDYSHNNPNAPANRYFELMSTANESLMGRRGGLLGLDPRFSKEDADMRNFAFGVLSNL